MVIKELIKIRKRTFLKNRKERIEADIKQVGQLNLCLGDYSRCHLQRIYINEIAGCLVYDKIRGKENNYMGELNLINQDYALLYQILNRYNLISYTKKTK